MLATPAKPTLREESGRGSALGQRRKSCLLGRADIEMDRKNDSTDVLSPLRLAFYLFASADGKGPRPPIPPLHARFHMNFFIE